MGGLSFYEVPLCRVSTELKRRDRKRERERGRKTGTWKAERELRIERERERERERRDESGQPFIETTTEEGKERSRKI